MTSGLESGEGVSQVVRAQALVFEAFHVFCEERKKRPDLTVKEFLHGARRTDEGIIFVNFRQKH